MSASRLQCETVVSEGQITWYFLALRLQHHKKDTESYYYASALPLSLSLFDFHSSPITSSNDSSLSCCTCGSSKNGSHMWEKSDAVTEIQSERVSVPRGIQTLPISVHFQLTLEFIFRRGNGADVNSLHHMPQLMCFTMDCRIHI